MWKFLPKKSKITGCSHILSIILQFLFIHSNKYRGKISKLMLGAVIVYVLQLKKHVIWSYFISQLVATPLAMVYVTPGFSAAPTFVGYGIG